MTTVMTDNRPMFRPFRAATSYGTVWCVKNNRRQEFEAPVLLDRDQAIKCADALNRYVSANDGVMVERNAAYHIMVDALGDANHIHGGTK